MKKQFEEALGDRAWEHAVTETKALNFSPELLKACEVNICGNYNRNWACPPAIGSLEEQKKKILAWKYAFVFTTRYQLEDSFDYEGMTRAKELHDELTRDMHNLFGGDHPVYGAGGCKLCRPCLYPEPCRFPGKMYPSIEAAGINVTDLSLSAGIKYNNGANTVTFFSMILFN
jgi:predicted metal-binding protein